MIIKKIISESSIDYPGKFGPVIFTQGCNFNCGFCHNPELISLKLDEDKQILQQLNNIKQKAKHGWYNGACITGGEPTIHLELFNLIHQLKEMKLDVKLDTNGYNPEVLKKLKEVIDYCAMDVKGPKELYSSIIQKNIDISKIEESMKIVQEFPDYEFRMTIVPFIRDKEISFLTEDEVELAVKWLVDVTGNNQHTFVLQKFIPINNLNDKSLEKMPETPDDLLKKIQERVKKILPNCRIR